MILNALQKNWATDSLSKFGHDFRKLKLSKKNCNKKCAPRPLFLIEKKIKKIWLIPSIFKARFTKYSLFCEK